VEIEKMSFVGPRQFAGELNMCHVGFDSMSQILKVTIISSLQTL
jgi:hypothetical protein